MEAPSKTDSEIVSEIFDKDKSKFSWKGQYRVQLWLNKTDENKLSLRVTTLSGSSRSKVCDTYILISKNPEVYSYKHDFNYKFVLLYEVTFSETTESEPGAATIAAEAISYLISRLIKCQYSRDPKRYLNLYEDSLNTEVSVHAQHWGSLENAKSVAVKLLDSDCFDIKIDGELDPLFDNLTIKYHKFYNVECTRESLKKFSQNHATVPQSPKTQTHVDRLSDEEYNCRICKILFINHSSVNIHMQRKHPELGQLKCKICSFQTHLSALMEKHKKSHEDGFDCPTCHFPFSIKASLQTHIRSGRCTAR